MTPRTRLKVYVSTFKEVPKEQVIRKCDIYIIVIIFLVLGIHFMTNYFMVLKSQETKADIEEIVKVYETNIFTKLQMLGNKMMNLIFTFIKPAIVLFFYWFLRKNVIENKAEAVNLQAYVIVFFFVTIVNFLNDFSILAGMLAKGLI